MADIVRNSHHKNLGIKLMQAGILLTFALLPLYYRFSVRVPPPLLFPRLYVSYFLLILPMLWTVACWLIFRLPGFAELRRDPLRRIFAIALLGLALWGFISLRWAFQRVHHPEVGETAALQLGIVLLFVAALMCSRISARAIVAALIGGLIVNSLIIVLQVINQGAIGLQFLDELPYDAHRAGISVLYAGNDYFVRPYGFMPHPNILAGMMLVGILAASTWLLSTRRWLRWIATILIPLGFGALLLTFSRAAWIGLVAGGVAILPLLRHDLRRRETRLHLGVTIGLVIAVGLIFLLAYRPFLAARTGTNTESVELRSVSDRLVFMDFAFQSITERTLLGVGIGNFPWRTSYYIAETFYDLRGDNVHHVTLSAWAELGLVGYALVIVALMIGVETALRRIKSLQGDGNADRAARIGLLGVVLAFVMIGLFDHYPWTLLHFQVMWWGSLALAGMPIREVVRNEE